MRNWARLSLCRCCSAAKLTSDSLRPHRLQLAIPLSPINSEFAQVHVHGIGGYYLKLHYSVCWGLFPSEAHSWPWPRNWLWLTWKEVYLHGRWTGCISQGLIKIDQTKKKKRHIPSCHWAVIGSGSRCGWRQTILITALTLFIGFIHSDQISTHKLSTNCFPMLISHNLPSERSSSLSPVPSWKVQGQGFACRVYYRIHRPLQEVTQRIPYTLHSAPLWWHLAWPQCNVTVKDPTVPMHGLLWFLHSYLHSFVWLLRVCVCGPMQFYHMEIWVITTDKI